MDRLAMLRRLQFFVHPPDMHCVEQAAVVQGVAQPVVVHATWHDLLLENYGNWRKIRSGSRTRFRYVTAIDTYPACCRRSARSR